MHLTVGDGDRAGVAGTRDIRQGAFDIGEQMGAGIAAFRYGDSAQVEVGQLASLFRDGGARGLRQTSAVADAHRS